jgi:NADP-dependent 3-hydroxy acid dehydrogenase YdfG
MSLTNNQGRVADVIGFILSRRRHLAINEVVLRPARQL